MGDIKGAKSACAWLLRTNASNNQFASHLDTLLQEVTGLTTDELQADYEQGAEQSLVNLLFDLCEKLRDPKRDKAFVDDDERLRALHGSLCVDRIAHYRLKLKLQPLGPSEVKDQRQQQRERTTGAQAGGGLPKSSQVLPHGAVSGQAATGPTRTMKDRLKKLRTDKDGLRNK
ncbi:MAG: hypothetical protein KIS74_00130 [Burkholderiales bacterium]|nr:hypothetical protein [Burkholderiales bacterium]